MHGEKTGAGGLGDFGTAEESVTQRIPNMTYGAVSQACASMTEFMAGQGASGDVALAMRALRESFDALEGVPKMFAVSLVRFVERCETRVARDGRTMGVAEVVRGLPEADRHTLTLKIEALAKSVQV